jgi:type IV pilus biogenesis protein CpaD/CtpE
MKDTESERMMLDGEPDLTTDERAALRALLQEASHTAWAMKRLKLLVPAAVAFVTATWAVWDWIVKHVVVKP